MVKIEFIENGHTSLQDYYNPVLIHDCIDELITLNGACNDAIRIRIDWDRRTITKTCYKPFPFYSNVDGLCWGFSVKGIGTPVQKCYRLCAKKKSEIPSI